MTSYYEYSNEREVKAMAYTTLVRPQLEYASEVWNPYSTTVVNELEQIQRSAARFVYCDYRYTTSPSLLVSSLGWDYLHKRRLLSQCTLFYKIHHQLVNVPFPPEITLAGYHGRHDHDLKYTIPKAAIDTFKFSFFPRTARIWNCLPGQVVNITGVDTFREAALPAIRLMQPPVGSTIM